VKVAFHFNADVIKAHYPRIPYHLPVLDKIFRSLLAIPISNLHVKIFEGDLLIDYDAYQQDTEKTTKLLDGLLGTQFRTWRDIHREQLQEAILSSRVYVVVLDGLSNHIRDYLLHILKGERSYIGAVQILGVNSVQWGFYNQQLSPHYRLINNELRIFYTMSDEDSKDKELETHWKQLPFKSVQWEDLGLRHTVFDAYESFEHTTLLVRLSEILSGRLSQLAEDVLFQLGDVNPELQKILYAAFKTYYSAQTTEEIAQVAISCRRFIEKLADTLYPARDEIVKGRSVDKAHYRNRLWAYVGERLEVSEQVRKLVQVELDDLGSRINKTDSLANEGLHAEISLLDLDRLLIALVTVTYDLLSLAPPPIELPIEPHLPEIIKFIEGLHEE